jgi:hypothetical protein
VEKSQFLELEVVMARINRCAGCLLVVVLVAFSPIGCGGSGKTTFDVTGKHKMEEIGQMLKTVNASGTNPPARLDDLERVEPMVPLSATDLRSGDVVYIWGASLSTGGDTARTLLAYEKKGPAEGGWALMQDGAVKQMTPQEFEACSKAK